MCTQSAQASGDSSYGHLLHLEGGLITSFLGRPSDYLEPDLLSPSPVQNYSHREPLAGVCNDRDPGMEVRCHATTGRAPLIALALQILTVRDSGFPSH